MYDMYDSYLPTFRVVFFQKVNVGKYIPYKVGPQAFKKPIWNDPTAGGLPCWATSCMDEVLGRLSDGGMRGTAFLRHHLAVGGGGEMLGETG